MSNKNYESIEAINSELEKGIDEMDTELIDRMIDETLKCNYKKPSKIKIYKMSNKIIKNIRNENKKISTFKYAVAVHLVIVILIISSVVFVSANKDFFEDGYQWLKNKLICSSVDENSIAAKRARDVLNSDAYSLPKSIPSEFVVTNYYIYERDEECSDICIDMANSGYYLNFIISEYPVTETSVQTPVMDTDLKEQMLIDDLTISVFEFDDSYSVYYSCANLTYQISTNMTYDEFVFILKSITKQNKQ